MTEEQEMWFQFKYLEHTIRAKFSYRMIPIGFKSVPAIRSSEFSSDDNISQTHAKAISELGHQLFFEKLTEGLNENN